jgi:hypothetical protein
MTLESINCTSDVIKHKKTFYSPTTFQLLLSLKLEENQLLHHEFIVKPLLQLMVILTRFSN